MRKIRRESGKTVRAAAEALEMRRLLAGFTGTSGNDTISIGINGTTTHVVINGLDLTTGDLSITLDAGAGQDSISIVGTRADSELLVLGGAGDDTLQNLGGDLDAAYRGSFLFEGGDGTDRVIADNSADSTTPADMVISAGSVSKLVGTSRPATSLPAAPAECSPPSPIP